MKEFINGFFCKDLEIKRPIQIRGFLGDFRGPVGCEGNIGFYDIEIKHREKFEKTNLRVCIKELNLASLSEHRESSVDAVLKKHSYLREIGLPIFPLCRGDMGNNLILMTDMTEKGKKIIIDKHNPIKDFSITNIHSLRSQLSDIAESAYYDDIFLSMDAYSIVVDNKTKEGKICLIDIGARTLMLNGDEFYINEGVALRQVESFLKSSNLLVD